MITAAGNASVKPVASGNPMEADEGDGRRSEVEESWILFTLGGGESHQHGGGEFHRRSQSLSQKVEQYIEGQAEHHRTFDFQAELRKLLDAHGVAYDERYVWD